MQHFVKKKRKLSMLFFVFLTLEIVSTIDASFELYKTDLLNGSSYHCMHYHVIDKTVHYLHFLHVESSSTQILSYCRRPEFDYHIEISQMNGSISNVLTFYDLLKNGVVIHDLLLWSAPIDVIERYQEYLEKPDVFSSIQFFYNCTDGWFGLQCEYTFPNIKTHSFSDVIQYSFLKKPLPNTPRSDVLNYTNHTLYKYLSSCDRGPGPATHLDWREICDGKVDCVDVGEDEMNCFALEISECADNEFRCHNGQCIPQEFYMDNVLDPDCSDSSDENALNIPFEYYKTIYAECFQNPAFRCEENSWRLYDNDFHCGDGQQTYFPFYTSSPSDECRNERNKNIIGGLYSYKANAAHISYPCWRLLYCTTYAYREYNCGILCEDKEPDCYVRLSSECKTDSKIIYPRSPIFDGHIRLAYSTDQLRKIGSSPIYTMFKFDYICFDSKRSPHLPVTVIIDNFTCVDKFVLGIKTESEFLEVARSSVPIDPTAINETHCRHSSLFHCPNTNKCISKHRLVDGRVDCYGGADERYNESCALNNRFRFHCTSNICLSPIAVSDGIEQCLPSGEDEPGFSMLKQPFSYSFICNGHQNLEAIMIEGEKETDETHCEDWPCDNVYTHCDSAWTCPNGSDERYCGEPLCSFDQHLCILPNQNQTLHCLSYEYVNDNIVHCLGASDEFDVCQKLRRPNGMLYELYRCQNSTSKCVSIGDICRDDYKRKYCPLDGEINMKHCQDKNIFPFFTAYALTEPKYVHFRLQYSRNGLYMENKAASDMIVEPQQVEVDYNYLWKCNRGILLDVGIRKDIACLCPPTYYGNRCQFQSQRVSLTLQFRYACDLNCIYMLEMIVSLYDDDGEIHSQEQFLYTSTLDCSRKRHIYLLYQFRPKNNSKNYYIRVDSYNKLDLSYYASWILPIKFVFLPVNRISTLLNIPISATVSDSNYCPLHCGNHGKCSRAVNTDTFFCRCHADWSGPNCSTPYSCRCSSYSVCLSPFICMCPLQKQGPRCYLNSTCYTNPCKNGGLCTPRIEQLSGSQYMCLCLDGFFGDLCEQIASRIDITFEISMTIPQFLLTHFITVRERANPLQTTIARKIPPDQDYLNIFIDIPFHLTFVEMSKDYHLIIMQENYTFASQILIQLRQSSRCPHVRELYDNQTANYPLLRRVKYYHVLCRKHVYMPCFRDDEAELICICTPERHANCLKYNFKKTYECNILHACENGAKCYQDRPCPTSRVCVCRECYYGSNCQFTTEGFGLSLDAILGYQIRRNTLIQHQSISVKISIGLTTVMLFAGLLSGTFSIMTFKNQGPREVGCGFYLLALSINSIFTILIFSYKFLFLLLAQMSLIRHRSLLNGSCIITDFILRSVLAVGDWLTAAVATERAFTLIQGTTFSKKKSRQVSRFIIIGIYLFTFLSFIHDPIHRDLGDDLQEGRTWCLIRYTPAMKIDNSAINIVHVFVPFSINLLSAFLIIITTAQIRVTVKKKPYREHLKEQFYFHKDLIISPLVLILLVVPRLVISFISGCMKSSRDPWLYLIGYFISFIPPILTFIIFVLPSTMYMKEFTYIIAQLRLKIRRNARGTPS